MTGASAMRTRTQGDELQRLPAVLKRRDVGKRAGELPGSSPCHGWDVGGVSTTRITPCFPPCRQRICGKMVVYLHSPVLK